MQIARRLPGGQTDEVPARRRQSLRHQPRARAVHQRMQRGEKALAQFAHMHDGQIHDLDDGEDGLIRRGEADVRGSERVKDALRAGEAVRAGVVLGDEAAQQRDILPHESRDAQLMHALKGGIDEGGGALLIAAPGALLKRAGGGGEDILLKAVRDLEEEALLALKELVERGFGDARVGGQRIERGLGKPDGDGVTAGALIEAAADVAALLLGKGEGHDGRSFLAL